jgi:hypothetical protein
MFKATIYRLVTLTKSIEAMLKKADRTAYIFRHVPRFLLLARPRPR